MLTVIIFGVIMYYICGASANDTGKVCYDQLICEDECCHDLDFGIPYCCSKYTGFIYLGLMVGGGIIIAILVIACYVCMKRTERELEAAAKLEAAKAANNACNTNTVDLSSETDQTDLDSDQAQMSDINNPPPTYTDVMRTFTRCLSCDVNMTATTRPNEDVINMLARQYSEGSHGPMPGLPPLVDINALIANHRRENIAQGGAERLPPLMAQDAVDNKLPTYEECTNQQMGAVAAARTRDYVVNDDTFRGPKAAHEILRRLGNSSVSVDSDRPYHEFPHQPNKDRCENDTHFMNINETMQQISGDSGETPLPSETPLASETSLHTDNTENQDGDIALHEVRNGNRNEPVSVDNINTTFDAAENNHDNVTEIPKNDQSDSACAFPAVSPTPDVTCGTLDSQATHDTSNDITSKEEAATPSIIMVNEVGEAVPQLENGNEHSTDRAQGENVDEESAISSQDEGVDEETQSEDTLDSASCDNGQNVEQTNETVPESNADTERNLDSDAKAVPEICVDTKALEANEEDIGTFDSSESQTTEHTSETGQQSSPHDSPDTGAPGIVQEGPATDDIAYSEAENSFQSGECSRVAGEPGNK